MSLGTKVVLLLNFGLLLFLVYPGFDATFTSLGASGKDGPTSLGNHYTGQDHDGQVTLSSGIQQWTVPYTGGYRIEAVGAAGGYNTYNKSAQYRGRGARMVGTFNLTEGEIIQILVGQEGGIGKNVSSSTSSGAVVAGGGGGGAFVVRGRNTSLIVAGGGGGLRAVTSRHQGCDANTNTSGNPGYNSWSGGSNGHGSFSVTGNNRSSGESNEIRPNQSSCKTFSIQMSFICTRIRLKTNSVSYEWIATKTRFDAKAKGNSLMAFCF